MNIEAISDVTVRNAPKTDPVTPASPPVERERAPVSADPPTQSEVAEQGAEAEEPERAEVEHVLDGINTFLKSDGSHIQFSLHQEAQRLMVQVVDNETQEVVRTFPPKELLDLAARIGEMVGTLIDQTG